MLWGLSIPDKSHSAAPTYKQTEMEVCLASSVSWAVLLPKFLLISLATLADAFLIGI